MIRKMACIISDIRYSVSFTWEYIWKLVVRVYFYTLLLHQTFAAKNNNINTLGLQKAENSYASAKQIIKWETVKIVIKPFIRLFFISYATWVFLFCFMGEIRMTSGLEGRNCLRWMF